MTNLELHVYIQQGLQNVNVFQYADICQEEFDLHIMRTIYKLIQKVFRPADKPPKEQRELELIYEQFQFTQDDFKILKIKDTQLNVSSISRGVSAPLPANYLHLINDRSIVQITCHENGEEVIKTKEIPNRLLKSEDLYTLLEDPFEDTVKDTPVSELEGNNIRVYTDGKFTVNSINIDYLRKPIAINTLVNPVQQVEFPEQMCHKIAEYCIIYLAKITEQAQEKIANLESEK
jgi:hypothetical protein